MNRRLFAAALASSAALGLALPAAAADPAADKTVVVEHVPAFPSFERWIGRNLQALPDTAPLQVQTVPLVTPAAAARSSYQPLPVILGLPELPLIGPGAAQAESRWSERFNYQGLLLRQVLLDARGKVGQVRSMSEAIPAGTRFKLIVSSTFDAVADIDHVVGDAWYGQRLGQVYPKRGLSVAMKAGETIELPVGANEYFVMGQPAGERLVLSIRHPKALHDARSDQPAYRQDDRRGSSYLQLVPPGRYPAIEQLISLEARR